MNITDFEFIHRPGESTVIDPLSRVARNCSTKRSAFLPAPDAPHGTVSDDDRFLRIIGQATQIKCHRDLFQLLQGEEIQRFIPHQVLISAWGNFDAPNLQIDIISAISGLRTALITPSSFDSLLKDLYKRWLTHGRRPLLLDSANGVRLSYSACEGALYKLFQGNWSLLVHGITDARSGEVSLYLALNTKSGTNGHGVERIPFLTAPLIIQIDVAFRRIAAFKPAEATANQASGASLSVLSTREQGILHLVSEGKTNIEISKILSISAFTVKNHMRRIMKKLNSANRTAAVATFRQMNLQSQSRTQQSIAA